MRKSSILACLFIITLSFGLPDKWQRTQGPDGKRINALISIGTVLFAGSADSGLFRSTDSGTRWQPINHGLTSRAIRALALSGPYLFAGTGDSGVFRSADSGATWFPINTGLSSLAVRALAVNDSYLFAGTNGGGICRSSDFGARWLEVNKGLIFNNIYSIGTNKSYVFVGTWGSSAFRSADNGMNWFLVTNGLPDPRDNIIPYCFAMSDTFIFTGTGGAGVFRAKDSARAWYSMNSGLSDSETINALMMSNGTLLAATQRGVFKSPDNGAGWVAANEGLNDTAAYAFAVIGTMAFAGTRDGVWKRSMTGLGTAADDRPARFPNSFDLVQNSPNPFNPATTLKYNIPARSFVSLKVYNSRGNLVASIANGVKSRGAYSVTWDASAFPSGVYVTRLKAGRWSESKVMLLAK